MIAIVKYNAGNIRSVENAVRRLGYECIITADEQSLRNADKVIFPGVGEASSAMEFLKKEGIDKILISLKQPVLGICLGMQLMCRHSEEGDTACLGILNARVKHFPPLGIVPHMGWNSFKSLKSDLFRDISVSDDVYYVHSYYAETVEETIAECAYILPFSAAMKKNNFLGVQFHPEKSSSVGEKILKNFLSL